MKYYKIPDLAKMFDVHPETIKREIQRNRLKYFKVGRDIRFTQEHVDEYTNVTKFGKTTREIELEKSNEQLEKELSVKDELINLIQNQIIKFNSKGGQA